MKISIIFILSSLSFTLFGQNILIKTENQGGSGNAGREFLVSDSLRNNYIGFIKNTWLPAVYGNSTIFGSRNDTIGLGLTDFFYLKLNDSLQLDKSFVIDNAEFVTDFFATTDHSFIGMTLYPYEQEDSLYPIIIGGQVEIQRENNLGKGVLTVLNKDLQVEKVLMPSTGGIGQIAAKGDFVYMEIVIPDEAPFIIVGKDTVPNFEINEGGQQFGFRTIVLCKYNYVTEEIIWWKRIGGSGYDQLRDMLIDHEGNLIIQGWTNSAKFVFSDSDSSFNYQADKPFIAKYTDSGNLIWRILNTDQNGEIFTSIKVDQGNNIYYIGQYISTDYHIGDTILHNNWLIPNNPTNRSLIIKYDKNGIYKWAYQLEGDFETSAFYDVTFLNEKVYVSGKFRSGTLIINSSVYTHSSSNDDDAFIIALDKEKGSYISHTYEKGPGTRWFPNIEMDSHGNLNIYLIFLGEDVIFDKLFTSYFGEISSFLVKLTSDFSTELNEIQKDKFDVIISPNPLKSGEDLNIKINEPDRVKKIEYLLTDFLGGKIKSGYLLPDMNTQKIKTGSLIPGLYILILHDNKTTKSFLVSFN